MGGEDVRGRDELERRIKIEPFLRDMKADALEREKGRMAFVHVKHFGVNPERGQNFDPADAKHDLLPHPHFEIAAVKLGGDAPIFRGVLGNVGIEKVKAHSPDVELPDLGKNFAIEEPH